MSVAKHQAKKLEAGSYLYRGYTIERVAMIGVPQQWNIYEPNDWRAEDCSDTLAGAKHLVDRILESK